jgi:hypothetical protein
MRLFVRNGEKGAEVINEAGKVEVVFAEATTAVEYVDMATRHRDEFKEACLEKAHIGRLQAISARHVAERGAILALKIS